jgi:membrane peptidoglycan carboxypeptidase
MSAGGSRTTSVGGIITLLGALLATSLVAGLLGAGLFMPAVGAAGATARAGVHAFDSLPAELKQSPLAQQSRILAADGSVIATFYDENRIVVPLTKIAPVMQQAIVAIEDDRFFQHGGIDPKGLGRAFLHNAGGDGSNTQGASTLTQQFVKLTQVENCAADNDIACVKAVTNRSGASGYARKIQELKYAVSIEKTMTKDQILQGYLNIAYFGSGTYGVESAALHYFGVHASQLNLQQAALLAGLVQAPTNYNPYYHLQAAVNRRNTVIGRMLALKKITQKQHDVAVASKIVLHKGTTGNDCTSSKYPYFCDYVRRILSQTDGIGAAALQRGGLTVRTTVQPKAQDAAQTSINKAIPLNNSSRVGSAATTIQPGTGKIISMVQASRWPTVAAVAAAKKAKKKLGWGYTTVNWNVDAAYGQSQGFPTGSSFKAYTLAAALEDGMTLQSTVNAPKSHTPIGPFHDCAGNLAGNQPRAGYYAPANDETGALGNISLYSATENSINTAFVTLEQEVGICKVTAMATKLGVHRAAPAAGAKTTALLQVPSMTLGTNEIAPMTMADAYATFAADGERCSPIAITSISSASGTKYAAPSANCTQVIDKGIAEGVTSALQKVLSGGTAAGEGLNGRESAGKTGTTNNSAQAWFVGYTPQLATAVYVGHPVTGFANRPLTGERLGGHVIAGGRTVFGGNTAAPIWNSIMNHIDDELNLSAKDFTRPPFSIIGTAPAPPTPTGGPTGAPTGGPTGQPTGGPTKGGPGKGGGNCHKLVCP